MTEQQRQGRLVKDVTDGGGLYFSRLATAGPYAFLAGVAVDSFGRLAKEVRVPAPDTVSPPAHVAAQTKYIYEHYKSALEELGSDINQMLQVEQYLPHKLYADAYLDTSRNSQFMSRGRPASALIPIGDLSPATCVVNPAGIALIPSEGIQKEIVAPSEGYHEVYTQSQFGATSVEEGPYNEVVAAGAYVFTVGDTAFDFGVGEIEPEAKASTFTWWGCEIGKETTFLIKRLENYLSRVGSTLADVVHSTVYLTDIGDLWEFNRVWAHYFGQDPPALTVVPVRGLAIPRWEGPNRGHMDNAIKMEHMTQSIRSGYGVTKDIISTGADALGPRSEAVRAGELLWISGQLPGDSEGLSCKADSTSQIEFLFGRLDHICRAAGTSISNLVRLRAFVTDPADAPTVYSVLRELVPVDPPTVQVATVPAPLPVPGAVAILDAVAYVSPEA